MHTIRTLIGSAILVGFLAQPAEAHHEPAILGETPLGTVLADPNGMTLYTFAGDDVGKSNCYDDCAQKWLPLLFRRGAAQGDFSIIQRNDGTRQWAFRGQPLYSWTNDKKPGDATGDGVGRVWQVARPRGTSGERGM